MYRAFFICLAFSAALLNVQQTRAEDFESLDNPPDEVINVIGNLPTYHNRTVNRIAQIDRLDATFMVAIDFEPTPPESVGDLRELIWETGGSGIGFSICYEHPNTLVVRATSNRADVVGPPILSASVELSQEQLDDGDIDVAWTWDANNEDGLQAISIILNDQAYALVIKDLYMQLHQADHQAVAVAAVEEILIQHQYKTYIKPEQFHKHHIMQTLLCNRLKNKLKKYFLA